MSDELVLSEKTDRAKRRSRWLEAALTIIVAQLLAVALLFARYSVVVSLSVAAVVATLFLTRRILWRAALWLVRKVRRIAVATITRLLDRRTYRFGLRSLLLIVLIVAVLSAWFGYRYRAESLERHLLHGRWLMFNRDDKPLIKPDGTPHTYDFSEVSYTIDPLSEPKRIDFHTPQGTMHAVYRWEGDDIVITQASPGGGRPIAVRSNEIESGTASPGARSIGTFRLRRSEDGSNSD
jgi:hypothetical protein